MHVTNSVKYDITPDPTLLEDIGAASYTVAEAIVELVANSIDARVDTEQLTIDVTASDSMVLVVDDASGMTEDVLARAVTLSVKDAVQRTAGQSRKGMYGLGMKTACASLGRYWAVVTRPVAGANDYRVEFDLEDWTSHRGDPNFKWEVEVTRSRKDDSGPLGDRKHGTAIIVEKLRHKDPSPGAITAQLAVAYKPHLERGDKMTVNTDSVVAASFDFIEGSRQEIDLDVGNGHRITGWVALDKRTHNEGNFGFNLYREDQCIETWNKQWFPAHLMTSRIVGDANLDFVHANFHKKGFDKNSAEWKLATAKMTEFLRPVVKASRTMSIGKNDASRHARALDGLNKAMGASDAVVGLSVESFGDTSTAGGAAIAEPRNRNAVGVEARQLQLDDGPVQLAVTVESFASAETPWDYVYDDQARELQAVLNANSKLFQKVSDQTFLGMLALADCVAGFLVAERGLTAAAAREIRNRWLFVALPE